jgi:hypothetical protein
LAVVVVVVVVVVGWWRRRLLTPWPAEDMTLCPPEVWTQRPPIRDTEAATVY